MNEARASLARMMPDAFPIFFDGRNPYEGQREVMPQIVRGNDVLFAAPTASGKTEAAITPLLQRHLSFRRGRLSTVYVAPTKALVNDLYERLIGYLGARYPRAVARYTGDRHEVSSAVGPFCVLATPEALDSLQLRRPEILADIRAVIIDEIHLLHGQPRGQQLRHVIGRLRQAARPPQLDRDRFQLVGMTATLDDMQGVARRWLGEDAKVISNGKARSIDLEFLPCNPLADPAREHARVLAEWLRDMDVDKLIVFSNSRNGAHALAAHLHRELEGERWPVHLHFGSLASSQREHVEEEMRCRRHGVCVATSTLEIGIDIGDVDAVVLADAPPTVSAFLQRIGRGNRRSGLCRVIAFSAGDEDERIMRALADCGARGELDDIFEYERYSVDFQQILSLCWRATRQDRPLTLEKLCEEAGCDLTRAVADMLDMGCLHNVEGALIPCDRLLDDADAGRIHSVIVGKAGPSVVDFRTGDVALRDADAATAGGAIFVGGQMRSLRVGPEGEAFLGDTASRAQRLARIKGVGVGQAMGRAVVRGLARQMGEDPDRWRVEGARLLTWGGETHNRLLAAIFAREAPGLEFVASAFDVAGPVEQLPLSLAWTRRVAAAAETASDLSIRVASRFTNPSKFLSELSTGLGAEERRRSVPWAPFRRWLEAVSALDGIKAARPRA
jgi:ATP-dependent Lhr-like helicase